MTSYVNIKKISKFLGTFFTLALLIVPLFAYSAPSPDTLKTGNEGTGIVYECVDAKGVIGNCDFQDLLNAVKKVVNFAVGFALFFSVVVIAFAGFKYMTSGDNASKRTEANKMLLSVAKGIVFILAAWLIVSLILRALQVDSPIQF
ncbi:MAG: hypothetical protein QG579_71 [Patescibacteria group bacterium]|jgi:hypothetical protein|nr:hypothetical protein [Patescibacteria group bacterium]